MNQKFISRSILLIISIYSLLASCTKEVDYGSLVERNGVKYEVNSDEGYTGNSVGYHENGQKSIQCAFIDGILDKDFTQWYDNGQLKFQCTYSKGVLSGLTTEYYRSGQLNSQFKLIDGEIDGHYLSYWENGKEKEVGQYSNGKKNGAHLFFNEKGDTIEVISFLDDSLHGEKLMYWDDGTVRSSGFFSHGKAINEHVTYFENKHVDERVLYDSLGNKMKREWYFDYNGDTSLYVYSYAQNHEISEKVSSLSGELRWFKEDSTELGVNYKRERHYNDGKLFRDKLNENNEWVYEYSDSGKLHRKYQWKDFKYNGRVYYYHESGQLKISGYYKDEKQTGTWKWFDEHGALTNTEIW